MNIDLKPDLESRLNRLAQRKSRSAAELVEEAIALYLDSWEEEPSEWVKETQKRLSQVWPIEEFGDWAPPHGR
ncbi:MAG: hypothetical protein ACP5XB_12875 [Isosphaeraceae bacterium]